MLDSSLKILEGYIINLIKKGRVSKETIEIYRNEIEDFIKFLENDDILKITPLKILSYIKNLKKNLLDSSVKRRLASINGLFKYLLKKEKITCNPIEGINIKIEIKPIKTKVEIEEINSILECCPKDSKGQRDKLVIELFKSSGLKISEILEIRMSDIINNKEINILKKTGKVVVNLNEKEATSLKEFIEEFRNEINEKKENYLFKELTRQNFRARFIKYCKLAGIKEEISPIEIKKTVKNLIIAKEKQESSSYIDRIKDVYMKIGIGDEQE
ncbi:MAG: tyrosine-type recombinase/integrase [Fusobacteriaceae bacterium]